MGRQFQSPAKKFDGLAVKQQNAGWSIPVGLEANNSKSTIHCK
jgi:hypothetical protein